MAIGTGTNKPQTITFEKQNGQQIVGLLHDTGSNDVVVLGHGFRSSKKSPTMVKIAEALEKESISAFRFDFSGNGDSDGAFQYSNYWGEVEDFRAVIDYFTKKKRRISAILGHSKGGNVVLLYASKYHDIRGVINVSGRYNLNEGIKERFGEDFMEKLNKDGHIDVKDKSEYYRVTKQSVMDRLEIKMDQSCRLIGKECRVLTIHGSADEIASVEDAFKFHSIIPNHALNIIKEANHCYAKHKDELTAAILSFVRDGL